MGGCPRNPTRRCSRHIEPGLVCDIALPADEGANLPDPAGLAAYDGIVLTGSHLNIYDATPEIRRQVDLMRAVYASRTPAFGSCWGLQVAAVAAGGDVRLNPAGWEVGIARRLDPDRGGEGPSDAGRPPGRLRRARHPPRRGHDRRRRIAPCSPPTPSRRSRPRRSAMTAARSGACSTIRNSASTSSR